MSWFRAKSVKDLANETKNIVNLGWWLQTHLDYESNPDYRQPPEETLKKRKGNCFALASLCKAVLKEWGIQGHILDWDTHAICAFKYGDKWMYFTNGILHKCSIVVDSLEDVARMENPALRELNEVDDEGYIIQQIIKE